MLPQSPLKYLKENSSFNPGYTPFFYFIKTFPIPVKIISNFLARPRTAEKSVHSSSVHPFRYVLCTAYKL